MKSAACEFFEVSEHEINGLTFAIEYAGQTEDGSVLAGTVFIDGFESGDTSN